MAHRLEKIFASPFENVEGYLIIENNDLPVSAGGLRVGPTIDLNAVRTASALMQQKFDLFSANISGAKSGIKIPENTSSHQREKIIRWFARELKPYLQTNYIIGEDLGTTPADVRMIFETIGVNRMVAVRNILKNAGVQSWVMSLPDFVIKYFSPKYTDQSIVLTAQGIMIALEYAVGNFFKNQQQTTISVQGEGNIGLSFFKELRNCLEKIIIVSVCDQRGVYRIGNVEEIISHIGPDKFLHLNMKPNASTLDWVKEKVDILVILSSHNIITNDNVDQIQAKIIIEGSNGGISDDAMKKLTDKGIIVFPDILVNSLVSCDFSLIVKGQASVHNHKSRASLAKKVFKEIIQMKCQIS